MYRSFLSWRYLRRRRTNLIGIVGILVAVGALILILSIMTGFLEESRRAARASLSDLIVAAHFGEEGSGKGPADGSRGGPELPLRVPPASVRDPAPVLRAIRADPRVEAASAHLCWFGILIGDARVSQAMLSASQSSEYAAVKLVGVDVDGEFQATELASFLAREPLYGERVADPSAPFEAPPGARGGRPRPAVVLGDRMFANHRLARGAVIRIGTALFDSRGEPEFADFECVVAGSFRSRENELDIERVYVDRLALARVLAGLRSPDDPLPADAQLYSEILVKLRDYEHDAEAAQEELHASLVEQGLLHPLSKVRTWEDQRRVILGAIENERVLMAIMLSLVLLVSGFTIFAILSMMVTEKRRDIGILTALGATPRGVMELFLMIGFWDALLGATLGALAGTWLALEIDAIERWLSSTFGVQIFNRDVYLFDYIPSVVEPLRVALIVLGAFACALVFAAFPAWKAARMDPLDALRYE